MPDRVLKTLSIKEGQTVVDIGSGGGYFTFRFASQVGRKGRVYAVDTKEGYLDFIRAEKSKKGLDNVFTVFADDMQKTLPINEVDLIFIRNVYHHLPDPAGYFSGLNVFLRPGGRIVIIDYASGGGFSFHELFGHHVKSEDIIHDLADAGYGLKESYDFIPEQSFLVFTEKT